MQVLNTPDAIQHVKNEIAQHYARGKPLTDAEISAVCRRFHVTIDTPEISTYIRIAEPHGDNPIDLKNLLF